MVYLKRLCHFFTYYCNYFKILLNENNNYLSGCVLFLCLLCLVGISFPQIRIKMLIFSTCATDKI